jgi:phage terminase large subunit-like protein
VAARRLRLDRTLGPLVVSWIEANLCHGPGDVQGQAVELDDERVKFIFGAYEIDDHGRRVVRRAALSRSKGWGKSEFAGMIVCAEALGPVRFRGWDHDGRPLGGPVQAPYIPVMATEEQQAGHIYGATEFMLQHGPISGLPDLDVGMTRTFVPGGGLIRPVTAKAVSKEGGRESFAAFDEPHLYVLPELHHLHDTIRRNLAKRKAAEPWSLEVSTMYAPGEDSVAEQSHAYAEAVSSGKIKDRSFLFDHRSGPREFDFSDDEQLRSALTEAYGGAAAWMDLERLIAEARDPMTEPSDFMRYFVNVPSKRESGLFIRSSVWDACADPDLEIADGARVCMGADGSRTFDTTVCAVAEHREDGTVAVDACVFSVRPHVAHHVLHEGGKIDFDDVEAFMLDCFDRWEVVEFGYDPRYLERSVEIIERRLASGLVFPVEPSSKHMREALQVFYRLAVEGLIRHDGDPVIAAHLGNCGVDRGHSDEIRRVRKIDERLPIDAVPAMALAVWRAVESASDSEPLWAFA